MSRYLFDSSNNPVIQYTLPNEMAGQINFPFDIVRHRYRPFIDYAPKGVFHSHGLVTDSLYKNQSSTRTWIFFSGNMNHHSNITLSRFQLDTLLIAWNKKDSAYSKKIAKNQPDTRQAKPTS